MNKKEKRRRYNKLMTTGLLLFMLFAQYACHKKEKIRIANRKYQEAITESRKDVSIFMFTSATPGNSIAVSIDGKLVWSEGFGFASKNLKVPASRRTKYRIGEISQVFTALVYHQFVAAGKLHPDSIVQHYLPDFPEKKFPVTLRHLASQSSGFRTQSPKELAMSAFHMDIQKGIDLFKNDPLLFKPGTSQYLSNYSYNLLGLIIERTGGDAFHKIVQKSIVDTLNLTMTRPDNVFATIEGKSDFFDRNIVAQLINAVTRDLQYTLPASGYLSTAEDLVKLGNALIDTVPSSPLYNPSIFQPLSLADGTLHRWENGWYFIENDEGDKIYAAKGNIYGGSALLIIYPKQKMVIAWCANLNDRSNEFPAFKIADHFLKIQKQQ